MSFPKHSVLIAVTLFGILCLSVSVYLFCDAFRVYQDQKDCIKKEEFTKLLNEELKKRQITQPLFDYDN
jgi:hypothetical protein